MTRIATRHDREEAWLEAFAYADCHTSTDDAVAFAHHYARTIEDEEDMNCWPDFDDVYAEWR
jgi:hypothetical protein